MQESDDKLKPTIGDKDVPPVEWLSGTPVEAPNRAAHEFVTGRGPALSPVSAMKNEHDSARENIQSAAEQRMRDQAAIRAAELRAKPLRKVQAIASTDAWFTAISAGLTLLTGFLQIDLLIAGGLLTWVAVNSFRGLHRIKRRDPSAFKLLALNQLLLAATVIGYCVVQMHASHKGLAAMDPDLASQLGSDVNDPMVKDLSGEVGDWMVMIWEAIAAGSLVVQGLMALYYMSKRHVMEEYLEETPDWILEFQKKA